MFLSSSLFSWLPVGVAATLATRVGPQVFLQLGAVMAARFTEFRGNPRVNEACNGIWRNSAESL